MGQDGLSIYFLFLMLASNVLHLLWAASLNRVNKNKCQYGNYIVPQEQCKEQEYKQVSAAIASHSNCPYISVQPLSTF